MSYTDIEVNFKCPNCGTNIKYFQSREFSEDPNVHTFEDISGSFTELVQDCTCGTEVIIRSRHVVKIDIIVTDPDDEPELYTSANLFDFEEYYINKDKWTKQWRDKWVKI